MRYAGINFNDVANGDGVCVTIWLQGCPHHCEGCFNPETWDFEGGMELPPDFIDKVIEKLNANGIQRNLNIMGGEPMCEENLFLTHMICNFVKDKLPDTKIYIWTGYTYAQLTSHTSTRIQQILELIDVLIDGPFIEEKKDLTLHLRGSSNQHIIDLTK